MDQIEKNNQELLEEESSIDFGKIFKDLLKHKTLYYKVLPVAFILAAIYALSLPNYYSCTVKLSPELSGGSSSKSGLASLASSFGVNLGSALGNTTEALFPTLYPELMNSVDFKTSLFEVPVTREEDQQSFTYYNYLMNEQKSPWWSVGMKAFFGLFGSDEEEPEAKVDPFKLTMEQSNIVKTIDENVVCDVDKKTMVITINVTDQDPLICATMADSVKTRLQKFITDYRTSKARVDLEYNLKLSREAKVKYEQARDRYVAFSDSHRDVSSQSAQTKQADLQNEMNMQQQIYQQVVAQLQQAEMKVQQETPAFTTLQSATVPVRKTGPKRAQMCLIFLFLAFLGTTAWILYKEDDLKPLLGLS
ncbi:MAG: chain-length determining protein [Prevotella sp.]|nr:chain-length determining protein [Prevotella sp.]